MSYHLSGRIKAIDLGLNEAGETTTTSIVAILGENGDFINLTCHVPTETALTLRVMEQVTVTLDFPGEVSSANPAVEQLPLPFSEQKQQNLA